MQQAWSTFENLHRSAIENQFLWHGNLILTEYGFTLLEHGDPGQKSKAVTLLNEAKEKFQEMGSEGYVELINSRLAKNK
jgi:hypothetical protein